MLTNEQIASYQKTWNDLAAARAAIEYDIAVFAQMLRAEFPPGPAGALQFKRWCVENLHVTASRARMLAEAAMVVQAGFVNAAGWNAIGGWTSIAFIMGCPATKRRQVYKAAIERSADLRHPITYSTVRAVAAEHGISTVRKGRPNRSEAERKLSLLRGFLEQIYTSKARGLPPIPDTVKAAMGQTILDQARRVAALKAA